MPTGRSSASTTYRRCRRLATSFSSTCARAADPRAWGARDRQRARRAQAQPHGRVGATDQCDALGGVLGPRVQNPCAACTRAAARGVPAGRRRRGRAGRACTNVSRAVASTSTWPTWQPADSRRRSSRLLANMDAGLFCTAARPWASRARDGGHRPACFARGRAPPAASPAGRGSAGRRRTKRGWGVLRRGAAPAARRGRRPRTRCHAPARGTRRPAAPSRQSAPPRSSCARRALVGRRPRRARAPKRRRTPDLS